MKKTVSLLVVLTLIFSFCGCGKKETVSTDKKVTNVEVSKVIKDNIESTVNYTGDVLSSASASVTPKAAGIVKAIHAEIGDFVNAGSPLFTIDSSTYQLSYNQAKAAYNSAIAAYNNIKNGSNEQNKISLNQSVISAQTNYDNALSNYNRQKALFDIGAISQVALDSAKTTLDNAKLALDTVKESEKLNSSVIAPQSEASAKAAVEQAKAAMDIASDSLNNCVVTAPISGYISSKNIQLGQTAAQGMEAFSIKGSDNLEVELNVTEAVIGSIKEGSKAKINIKSANIKDVEGIVTVTGKAKNDRTGMFTVKVSVPNDNENIKVGMIADVSLVTGKVENTLIIPQNALLQAGDEYYVYVAEGEKAVKKVITTGISDEINIEVTSGLKEGENVITEGKDFLSDDNTNIKITSK